MARTPAKVQAAARSKAAIAIEKEPRANELSVKKARRFKRTTIATRKIRHMQRKDHGLRLWVEPFIRAIRDYLPNDKRIANDCKIPMVHVIQQEVMSTLIDASRLLQYRGAKKLAVRDLRFREGYSCGSNSVPCPEPASTTA